MLYLLIVLLIIGFLALILSFFKDTTTKRLEEQIEGTSITVMQELYKVKKKLRVLEEELMIDNEDR